MNCLTRLTKLILHPTLAPLLALFRLSSGVSHSLPDCHSRSIVRVEVFMIRPTASVLSPPKKRSSTTWFGGAKSSIIKRQHRMAEETLRRLLVYIRFHRSASAFFAAVSASGINQDAGTICAR